MTKFMFILRVSLFSISILSGSLDRFVLVGPSLLAVCFSAISAEISLCDYVNE